MHSFSIIILIAIDRNEDYEVVRELNPQVYDNRIKSLEENGYITKFGNDLCYSTTAAGNHMVMAIKRGTQCAE